MSARYDRQVNMPGFGIKAQKKLQNSSVLILGVGGLGCAVATYLSMAGVGRMTLCDGDVVGLSNLNRQFLYTGDDIGKSKVDCAVRAVEKMAPRVKVGGINAYLTSDNADVVVPGTQAGSYSMVLDCLDSFDARKIAIQTCFAHNIPLLHGACEEYQGQVLYMDPGLKDYVCLGCYLEKKQASTPMIHPVWVLGATAGIVGSMMASMAVGALTGTRMLKNNRIYCYDGMCQEIGKLSAHRSAGCPVCGNLGSDAEQ